MSKRPSATGKGRYNWAKPSMLKELPAARGRNGLEIWATFDHDALARGYGNICYPLTQKRYPLVLFRGETTADEAASAWGARYKFERMSLALLAKRAHQAGPRARLGNCDKRCCYPETPQR